MGIDEQSKGIWIYWPDKMTVSIERNVYYNKSIASVPCLEGEEGIVETKTDLPKATKPILIDSSPDPIPTPPQIPSPPPAPEPNQPVEKHICKPSQCIQDIMGGHGSSSI